MKRISYLAGSPVPSLTSVNVSVAEFEVTLATERLETVPGGGGAGVVAEAAVDCPEALLAASKARTVYEYVVAAVRLVFWYVVTLPRVIRSVPPR